MASIVVAHGDIETELAERRRFLDVHTNNLDHCARKHQAGLDQRAVERRADRVASLLAASGLQGKIPQDFSEDMYLTVPRTSSINHQPVAQFKPALQRLD